MRLHLLVQLAPGFAREDAPTASAIGAYTDEVLAKKLALVAGYGTQVISVELNAIPPGFLKSAEALGLKLPLPASEVAPAS